ncbi:MAG: hypothetical protein HYX68_06670 [Planctomycetes bacterium]|nr:hypothetical protein [Planctomycetota bacterium]
MAWPENMDYYEAVQAPGSFSDPELKLGQVTSDALGLPRACTGNFADVYQIACPNNHKWAVKCFTREIPGLQQRYQVLSDHLQKVRFPFTVDFGYLAQGIRVRGQWFPLLKMRWVEGITLNTFVHDHLDKPQRLRTLVKMWISLAKQLRAADIAHGDLQHGNVLLVPSPDGRSARLTLIDYDGMSVPALMKQSSGEVGHPCYQHPDRLENGLHQIDVDRFSHLMICCALQCLAVAGRPLWERFDNGDNLLFHKEDFADPHNSALFRELWQLQDPLAHALVGNLILACKRPMVETPAIDLLFQDGNVVPKLSAKQQQDVEKLLRVPQPSPAAANRDWWQAQVERMGNDDPQNGSSKPITVPSSTQVQAKEPWWVKTATSSGESTPSTPSVPNGIPGVNPAQPQAPNVGRSLLPWIDWLRRRSLLQVFSAILAIFFWVTVVLFLNSNGGSNGRPRNLPQENVAADNAIRDEEVKKALNQKLQKERVASKRLASEMAAKKEREIFLLIRAADLGFLNPKNS